MVGLGLVNSFRVDAQGQSGGIWLLWKSEVGNVMIEHSISQFVHAKIENYGEVVNLMMVYAARALHHRRTLWGELHEIASLMVEPMFIGAYFNTIVRFDERTGGNGKLSADSIEFSNWINNFGNRYTWKRGKTSNTYIAKRLDRVLLVLDGKKPKSITFRTSPPITRLYTYVCPHVGEMTPQDGGLDFRLLGYLTPGSRNS
ncbi:hypothetical protein V2J09_013826 [Rumex salicifolius]